MLLAARIRIRCPANCLAMSERLPDTTSDRGMLPLRRSAAPPANAILATSPCVEPSNGTSSRRPSAGGHIANDTNATATVRNCSESRDRGDGNRIRFDYRAIVNARCERAPEDCVNCAKRGWVRFCTTAERNPNVAIGFVWGKPDREPSLPPHHTAAATRPPRHSCHAATYRRRRAAGS